MKYIMIIADGMADDTQKELSGMTPLAYAKTEMLDFLAKKSELGLVQTIPKGMEAGSDIAGLTILGYDAKKQYCGRGSLELLGLNSGELSIELKDKDIVYRMNLVTILEEKNIPNFENGIMMDHTAGQISTEEAKEILKKLQKLFDRMGFKYYTETSYRHLLVGNSKKIESLTPPHNILGQPIKSYLPQDGQLYDLMKESYHQLQNCKINQWRVDNGKFPANSIWLWGGGSQYHLENFKNIHKKQGAMLSAVAVLKGIANGCGMVNLAVQGATGTVDTNYGAKAERAIFALLEESYDFVCVHVEAPDEASHRGCLQDKIYAIEQIDKYILKPIVKNLKIRKEDFRLLFLPDHYTLVKERVHTSKPVPYLLYDSTSFIQNNFAYNEKQTQFMPLLSDGTKLIQKLFSE